MKTRIIGSISILAIAIAVACVSQDFVAFCNGRRPVVPFFEDVFSAFFHHRRECVLVRVPMREATAEVSVAHQWRGKYQFYLWIPDEISGFASVSEIMGVKCEIYNKNGDLVCKEVNNPSENSFWFKDRVIMKTGSWRSLCVYYSPRDVPLDDCCHIKITLTGEVDAFFKRHPVVYLVLQKERDK